MTTTAGTTLLRRHSHVRAVAATGLALAALSLAGCSGGSSDTASSGSMPVQADTGADTGSGNSSGSGASSDGSLGGQGVVGSGVAEPARGQAVPDLLGERDVISTAVVSLASDDASDSRAEVIRIVDVHRGQVTDEETTTDGDGAVERSRMVVRVPVSDFYDTVQELEGVAELESSDKSSENVSSQVIDTAVRVRAQERSLRRIEVLLARSQTVADIVNIESELTRRQAELDSLKSQQAYLADQTAMSTITVHLEQKASEPKPEPKPETKDAGFLAGLAGGWGALLAVGTVLATITGALLPWLVVFGVLGAPVWLVSRRLVRRRPAVAAPHEG